jgi:hypothetical protein
MARGGIAALGVVLGLGVLAGCSGGAAPAAVVVTPTPTPSPTATSSYSAPVKSVDPLVQATKENPLYGAGKVPAVPCKLPASALGSDSQMLKYARVMVDCMKRAWDPLLTKVGTKFWGVEVASFTHGKGPDSPLCATPPKNSDAFYRRDGSVICLDRTAFRSGDPVLDMVDFQQLLAHEYSHHVQMASMILTSYNQRNYRTDAARLEDERRKELQASCFGAAFLGANKKAFRLSGRRLALWQRIVHNVGDRKGAGQVRDHGSTTSHAYWTLRAFAAGSPAACNTFSAPAKRVS